MDTGAVALGTKLLDTQNFNTWICLTTAAHFHSWALLKTAASCELGSDLSKQRNDFSYLFSYSLLGDVDAVW